MRRPAAALRGIDRPLKDTPAPRWKSPQDANSCGLEAAAITWPRPRGKSQYGRPQARAPVLVDMPVDPERRIGLADFSSPVIGHRKSRRDPLMSSSRRTRTTFQRFIGSEATGGLVLMVSAAFGLAMANSPLAQDYKAVMHSAIGRLDLLHWINDGLMTFFFLFGRARDQARDGGGATRHLAAARPSADRGSRRNARPGADLHGDQFSPSGELARLGGADCHRHCLCPWRFGSGRLAGAWLTQGLPHLARSEEHTSELQSLRHL